MSSFVTLELYLKALRATGGTDLYLQSSTVPRIRRADRLLQPLDAPALDAAEMRTLVENLLGNRGRRQLADGGDAVVTFDSSSQGRFRLHAMRVGADLAAIVRALPIDPPALDTLGLPVAVVRATSVPGLVVVAGPARSGRTTTVGAILQELSVRHRILTLEDPVELTLKPGPPGIVQHTIGEDTPSLVAGLEAARQASFSVVAAGALKTSLEIEAAIELARGGRLVVTTLLATTPLDVRRALVDAYPMARRPEAQERLAGLLCWMWCQQLLPAKSGEGAALAHSLAMFMFDEELRSAFAGAPDAEFEHECEHRQAIGQCTLNQSLVTLYRQGRIGLKEAFEASVAPSQLQEMINGSYVCDRCFAPGERQFAPRWGSWLLHYCGDCGQRVGTPYSPSDFPVAEFLEYGDPQPGPEDKYFCEHCNRQLVAPNLGDTGAACRKCRFMFPLTIRFCAFCGTRRGARSGVVAESVDW